jgi:hypothetical protein
MSRERLSIAAKADMPDELGGVLTIERERMGPVSTVQQVNSSGIWFGIREMPAGDALRAPGRGAKLRPETRVRGIAMNRLGRIGVATALAMALGAFASPAFACSIMPPPPPPIQAAGTPQADVDALAMAWGKAHGLKYAAENRDWAMRQQVRLFDEAGALVLVRYVREDKTKGLPKEFDYMNGQPMAVLKPIRWIKGSGGSAEINIGSSMPPPCGQMTGQDALYGKPGDVFLVYLSGGAQPTVMEGYSLDRIIEPRTIAALTKGPE